MSATLDRALARVAPGARSRPDPALLGALLRLAGFVTRSTGEHSLVEAVAETALELLAADSLSISRLDPDGHHLVTVINVGDLGPGEERWPDGERYRVADFPETLAFLRGGEMHRWGTHVDDVGAEGSEVALLRSLGKTSSLYTPITVAGQLWGELWATRAHPDDAFEEADHDLAGVIVALVAAGLAQASAWRTVQAQAATDPLTGLANRRAFDEHLTARLAATRRSGRPLALVVGDVDGLKRCNDTSGHAAGDDALLQVARAASEVVSGFPGGLAARLGGDEFALVLPDLAASSALAAGRRWMDLSKHDAHGTSLSCGVSVTTGPELCDPRDLMRDADTALYAAKSGGGPDPMLASPRSRDAPSSG